MKINERWLREWADVDLASEAIAEKLTLAGLEVEDMQAAGPRLDGVVVAEVVAVAAHPDAERLALCRVADGDGEHEVVCGAPNVHAGMKTAYARPGTVLAGDRAVANAVIRGVESAGMLCSAAELGLGDAAEGIVELPSSAANGTALAALLELDDVVFDIGLTPNRGDCFCAIGIARDLGVLCGRPIREPVVEAVAATCTDKLPIVLAEPAACPRYAGRVIRDINPGAATPLWMSERLRRAGVRAIHPLVDITNFVMLELGQPMHAFDLDKLVEGIEVRDAQAGEQLLLLDGQALTLEAGTLVIADHERAVALAGVMGGELSAVGDQTRNLFLESAYFDPIRLAGVARQYRLHTDASMRFERGIDPTMQERAVERATALVLEICGGQPGPLTCSEDASSLPATAVIDFRPASVNRLLGTAISEARIADILVALGMVLQKDRSDAWRVTPPTWRRDIALEADLIEEVARIEGYDAIPVRLPRGAGLPAVSMTAASREQGLRSELVARGYFEAITYSFVTVEAARSFHPQAASTALSNPISADMSVMRPNLWPGLLGAAVHNINRQHEDVRLFEIGQVFADGAGGFSQEQHIGGVRYGLAQAPHWAAAARESDFFDIKQDVVAMLQNLTQDEPSFAPSDHPALHPGQCAMVSAGGREFGYVGALHPAIARQYEIIKPLFLFEFMLSDLPDAGAPQFRPLSRFPAVRRDINVVVAESVSADACLAAAREGAGPLLRDLQLIDVYRGQGIDSDKKSLTLGLIFQDVSSTLRDEEVEAAVARALKSLRARVGGILRD